MDIMQYIRRKENFILSKVVFVTITENLYSLFDNFSYFYDYFNSQNIHI